MVIWGGGGTCITRCAVMWGSVSKGIACCVVYGLVVCSDVEVCSAVMVCRVSHCCWWCTCVGILA